MKNGHWYLIAYDIRDPKRLRRVHYYLKKHAWMAQRSVYLTRIDNDKLGKIRKTLTKLCHRQEDDIRLYPIDSPRALWEAGPQPDALAGVARPGKSQKPAGLGKKLKNLFKRKKEKTA